MEGDYCILGDFTPGEYAYFGIATAALPAIGLALKPQA